MNDKPDTSSSSDKTMSKDELWIKESLSNHLDAQVESLDYTVTSKLSAARHRALALEQPKNSIFTAKKTWFSWTAALASTAVLVLAVTAGMRLLPQSQTQTVELAGQMSQAVLLEDLNLLSASDDIEFYQSVEFLEWMESNSG